jgi:hypothetical protein
VVCPVSNLWCNMRAVSGGGPMGRWRRQFRTWGELAMTMADRDGLIWLDGAMVPWREAKVHVLTHTLHYGMGVFEGIRAYETARGTAMFRLAEHRCSARPGSWGSRCLTTTPP